MKTLFIRTLMVTLLATSISAFAQSDDGKRDDAATASNVTQQNDCNRKANDAATQNEQQSTDETEGRAGRQRLAARSPGHLRRLRSHTSTRQRCSREAF